MNNVGPENIALGATSGPSGERVGLLPNWADLEFLNLGKPSLELRKQLGVGKDDCLFLYSGNIGKKQGLENLLQAAKRLESKPDLKLVIVGTGAGKDALVQESETLGLTNVLFHPLQPLETLPALLKSANYHLVLQKGEAGDLVLPSKLTNILGVGGHAIVTAHDHTELGIIAKEDNGVMTCITPDCSETLHDALLESYEWWKESRENAVNNVALAYAKENLDKGTILNKFIERLNQAIR